MQSKTTSKTIYALLVSVAALTSVGAHADNQVRGFDQVGAQAGASASTKTRAEVKNELLQAQRQGLDTAGNYKHYPAVRSASVKTRAQVRSELIQAQAEGTTVDYQH